MASPFAFIDPVVVDRHLVVTSAYEHACRLEPVAADLSWFCDLDDGTPTGENDPASSVSWLCPALRLRSSGGATATPLIDVRRSGPQSDLGKLFRGLGRRLGGAAPRPQDTDDGARLVYTDPAGILDDALRLRIENWPPALHGDGLVRPAELTSIALTNVGLVVTSVSWWGSTAALDHQIGLAIDIARRVASHRQR